MLAAGVALFTVSRPQMTWRSSLGGAVAMGGGIGSMHYIGMFAMRMPATMEWDLRIVALSAVVAVTLSLVALRLSFRLHAVSGRRSGWNRIAAAIVMGSAITGMHYTGMAAATFVTAVSEPSSGLRLSGDAMGGAAIAFITLPGERFRRRVGVPRSTLRSAGFRARPKPAPPQHGRRERPRSCSWRSTRTAIITIAEGRDLAAITPPAESMIGRSFFAVYSDVPALIEQAHRASAETSTRR